MRSLDVPEIAWKKSSYSAANGDCVEVARLANDSVGVRDSKNIAQPVLGFTHAAWQAFVGDIKADRLDPA